ncbi:probable F-box protein At4g22165 [Magnolia sinica]|uniref:probable F-box protein At4g22165 n=1 Tax=Magnolia sinica TaxID=86752 RepID=UPI002659B283|nr:probable F-box protein At4g22165 [Magnolia sinica]
MENNDISTWSQLPTEILVTILMGLYPVDCIHAGAVCVSWHAAMTRMAARNLNLPMHKLPCLILSKNQETKIHRFLSLSDNKIYRLYVCQSLGASLLGCLNEWLILMDNKNNGCFILNVNSKERIQLPRQARVWNLAGNRNVEDFWEHGPRAVGKAILSSDPTSVDCKVVITYLENTLVFLNLGDPVWTAFEGESDKYRYLHDIIFYHGLLHIVRYNNELTIYELGHDPDSTNQKMLPLAEPRYPPLGLPFVDDIHLVESHGNLLMILRFYEYFGERRFHRRTTCFHVFKMDASGTHWINMKSLDGQMIFLGYPKSLSTEGLSDFKRNCIYFTSTGATYNYDSANDSGIFNLEDGSIKRFPSKIRCSVSNPATGIIPYTL